MKIVVKYYLSAEGKKRAAAGIAGNSEQELFFNDPTRTLAASSIGVVAAGEPDTMLFDLRRRGLMIWENNRRNYYLKDYHYSPLSFSREQWRDILKMLLRLYGLTRFNVQMGVTNYLDQPITSIADLITYEAQEKATRQKMEELVDWINEEYQRLHHEIHERAKKTIADFVSA